MKTIKVKTPAKINLTLEVMNQRPDGFHNIQSIMHTISLFDRITISVENSPLSEIVISGNSDEIPYDNRNIAYKACEMFLEKVGIKNKKIEIYIDKTIPVSAGLAGGSSNAAGVLYGLNKLFDIPLNSVEISEIAAQLGSDVSFCLFGGAKLASGRGELLEKMPSVAMDLIVVKPKNIAISAKEAYQKFAELEEKPKTNNTLKMFMAINKEEDIAPYLLNHLEIPILRDYPRILEIKNSLMQLGAKATLMSGSGSSVFAIVPWDFQIPVFESANVFKVKTIKHGVKLAD